MNSSEIDKQDIKMVSMKTRPYDNGNELNRLLKQIKKRRENNSNQQEIIRFKSQKAKTAANSRRGSPASLMGILPHKMNVSK